MVIPVRSSKSTCTSCGQALEVIAVDSKKHKILGPCPKCTLTDRVENAKRNRRT